MLTSLRRAATSYRRTAGDLAASSLVSAGGLTLRAERLEEAGLILRERDEDDRRIAYVQLTDAGLALIDGLAEEHFANELDMLVGLVSAETQAARGVARAPGAPAGGLREATARKRALALTASALHGTAQGETSSSRRPVVSSPSTATATMPTARTAASMHQIDAVSVPPA